MLLGFVLARAVFAFVGMFAAAYCILAYVPFTYHQIVRGGLFPWVDVAVRHYGWILAASLVCVLQPAWHHLKAAGWSRYLVAATLVLAGVLSVLLIMLPLPQQLANDGYSLIWAISFLIPPVLFVLADINSLAHTVQLTERTGTKTSGLLWAALSTAIFVTGTYVPLVMISRGPNLPAAEVWTLAQRTLAGSLILLVGIFLVLDCTVALAAVGRNRSAREFWFVHAVFSIVTAHFLNSFVGVPLGLVEPIRWSLSAALAATITLTHAAVALRACGQQVLENGIGAAFAPEAALAKGRVRAVVVLLGIGVLASVVTAHTARMDWDHMAGSTVAYTLWVVSFGCFYGMMRSAPAHRYVRHAAIVAVLLFFRWSNRSVSAAELSEVAAVNGSFQLTRHMPSAAAADDSSFYRFLSGNTNIPTSVRIAPVDIQFSNLRYTPSEKRPHIFVFVIDSLRRDYLSPYNRAVTFTPAIAQFAGESIVFQNAFTRYGGTGLSEPSIWTGALLLHKQYITPFRPMNTLQKMLRAERYQLFLTRDSILRVILDPDPSDIELDPPDSTMNYEFGRSLAELARRIDHRSQAAEPIFAYTQPQDLHISVIRRQGANCSDCDRYRGFYAPYAERVQQIDKALGTFLAFLKARGLYEESIVVLTADHGDSLGEEGRWGHAYTLFPEIVRIPLILHLPAALRQRFVADGTRLAFSTDITPTLYTLLGMKTGPEDMIHGETLFSNSLAAQTPRTGSYLLAASYAPVYGLVTHGGAKYFVADAVNRTTRSFDLRGAQPVTEEMSDSETVDKKKIIRSAVTAIGRYYGLLPEINK